MTEPIASTAVPALGGVTIALAGSFFGMPFDSMAAGFIGALVAQTFVPPPIAPAPDWVKNRTGVAWEILAATMSKMTSLWQLIAAGLLAGVLSRAVEGIAMALLPGNLSQDAVHLATGGVIGMIAPVVVPLIRKLAIDRADNGKAGK